MMARQIAGAAAHPLPRTRPRRLMPHRLSREASAFVSLVVRREVAVPFTAILALAGIVVTAAVVLLEFSIFRSPLLTRDVLETALGVRSIVPTAIGVITAWVIAVRLMRRAADDAESGWLDPLFGGGASRPAYVLALWIGAVGCGVVLHLSMVATAVAIGSATDAGGATFTMRSIVGAFAVLCDTAAYALVASVLVPRRLLGPAVAIIAVAFPFVILTAETAGQIGELSVGVRRLLTLYIPLPVQTGRWSLAAYQAGHAGVLLAVAAALAPRRIGRGS